MITRFIEAHSTMGNWGKFLVEHGDLYLVDGYEGTLSAPEFNDDTGTGVFIACERS